MSVNRFTTRIIASLGAAALLLSGCSSNHTENTSAPTAKPYWADYIPVTEASPEAQREAYAYFVSDERRQRIHSQVQIISDDLLARMQSGEIKYVARSYSDNSAAPTTGYGRLIANDAGDITDPGTQWITLYVRFKDGKIDEQTPPLGFRLHYGGWSYSAWGEYSLTIGEDRSVVAVKDGPLSYGWSVGELGADATKQLILFLTGGGHKGPQGPAPQQDQQLMPDAPYVVWIQGAIVGSEPATADDIRYVDSTVSRALDYLSHRFTWQP